MRTLYMTVMEFYLVEKERTFMSWREKLNLIKKG